MRSELEFVGKNVEQAVEKACKALSLSPTKLEYHVISSGSSGIFGLVGVRKARIRVNVSESEQGGSSGVETKSENHSFEDSTTRDDIKSLVDEAFNGSGGPRPKQPQKRADKPTPSAESPKTGNSVISKDSLRLGEEALQKILDLITTDATISIENESDRVRFNVSGGNTSVLIGKRGQNLEAIQYIIDKIINKHNEKRVRVQVDVEGYLETRRANLKKLARKLAQKTKRTSKPSTIGQMNAQDRRTVHIALKNDKGVRTQSIGEGYYRKLVIFPKRGNNKRKKPAANNMGESDR